MVLDTHPTKSVASRTTPGHGRPAEMSRTRTNVAVLLWSIVSSANVLAAEPDGAVVSPAIVDSKIELFVDEVEPSTRFYEALGFSAETKSDGYTTLRCGGTVIALSPVDSVIPLTWLRFARNPPLGTEIVLYTDRLDALHAAIDSAGYGPTAIVRQPWGLRDFRVHDPAGYYVRITEGRSVGS